MRPLGFALVLLATLTSVGCTRPPAAPPPPSYACDDCNLLLISIDTLRADHLGCYGYHRPTSPRIDDFASRSILFEQAHSTSHHTADSHMSIFTGLFPSVHGVRNAKDRQAVRLADGIRTVTEVLADAGFATVGFHDGGNLSPAYGFGRGFERYERAMSEDAIIDWLGDEASDTGRWFAFYHTYHVHDPYLPEAPNDTRYSSGDDLPFVRTQEELDQRLETEYPDGWNFADLREIYWGPVDGENPTHVQRMVDLYDGEIHEADAKVGRVLDAVEALGERTIVVITSDHGEAFMEHGSFRHLQHLYQSLIHVPLILHHPDHLEGRRITPKVSAVDLAPTILDVLGVGDFEQAQGRSLVPLMQGESWDRAVFAEKVLGPDADGFLGNASLIEGDRKLHYYRSRGAELYTLDGDPDEGADLADEDRRTTNAMLDRLQAMTRGNKALRSRLVGSEEGSETVLDEETIRQLEALGYLQ